MNEELERCPFCGSEAELCGEHDGYGFWVCCKNELCEIVQWGIYSKSEAIQRWNSRVK